MMAGNEIGRGAVMGGPPDEEGFQPYRYRLDRYRHPDRSAVAWVMLNPSTADGMKDDPTLRRVMDFTWDWGFDRAIVVNLYALRSPKPEALLDHSDPIGPGNVEHVRRALGQADLTICAWGSWWHNTSVSRRPLNPVIPTLVHEWSAGPVQALRISTKGHPWHPLYVPGNIEPVDYGPERADLWR